MEQHAPHNMPKEFHLTHIMDLAVGNYFFYGNIVVVEAREGIVLSYKKNLSVILAILNITKGEPWVYVSNRINSYAINMLDYKYLNKVPTLRAIGIVNYNDLARLNTTLEVKFCKKPFKVFNNLREAVVWGVAVLGNKSEIIQ